MSDDERQRALCYQVVSRVIDYPGQALRDEMPMLRAATAELPPAWASWLRPVLDHIDATALTTLQEDYVATFDLRRKCSLYLTYFVHGDTRNRGTALLTIKQTYRAGGVELDDSELPDHLAVVLEFAATVDPDAGRVLLIDHRAGLELLKLALSDAGSVYAGALEAVTATLPRIRGDVHDVVRRLVAEGPPGEQVGLEPFGPPSTTGVRR